MSNDPLGVRGAAPPMLPVPLHEVEVRRQGVERPVERGELLRGEGAARQIGHGRKRPQLEVGALGRRRERGRQLAQRGQRVARERRNRGLPAGDAEHVGGGGRAAAAAVARVAQVARPGVGAEPRREDSGAAVAGDLSTSPCSARQVAGTDHLSGHVGVLGAGRGEDGMNQIH